MDFERKRRARVITIIQVAAVLLFFSFTICQIYKYINERAAARELIREHTVSADVVIKEDPVDYSYKGEHPYASVDLPYDLASLTIETDQGSAQFINGKSAGINIDVTEIKEDDTVTAVGLYNLDTGMISMSGTGTAPSINMRYSEGYSIRISLDHAIQASFDKDGTVKIYNLNKGDRFEVTYTINPDSSKYPGTTKFTFMGEAEADGALSLSLMGSELSVSGVNFNKAMLSDKGSGIGIPIPPGDFTYDFKEGK